MSFWWNKKPQYTRQDMEKAEADFRFVYDITEEEQRKMLALVYTLKPGEVIPDEPVLFLAFLLRVVRAL